MTASERGARPGRLSRALRIVGLVSTSLLVLGAFGHFAGPASAMTLSPSYSINPCSPGVTEYTAQYSLSGTAYGYPASSYYFDASTGEYSDAASNYPAVSGAQDADSPGNPSGSQAIAEGVGYASLAPPTYNNMSYCDEYYYPGGLNNFVSATFTLNYFYSGQYVVNCGEDPDYAYAEESLTIDYNIYDTANSYWEFSSMQTDVVYSSGFVSCTDGVGSTNVPFYVLGGSAMLTTPYFTAYTGDAYEFVVGLDPSSESYAVGATPTLTYAYADFGSMGVTTTTVTCSAC
jgi:hypothetical protein